MPGYAHPVAQHKGDPNVRIAEVDVDTKAYDEGHAPNAIDRARNSQLCDTLRRDILSKEQFEELMAASGVTKGTTVIIYGDNNNWRRLGPLADEDLRARRRPDHKWRAEEVALGGPRAHDRHSQASADELRPQRRICPCALSFRKCKRHQGKERFAGGCPQPARAYGLAPPGLPETCQRGGHIPGARSIPWGKACDKDGRFKTADELKALYGGEADDESKPVIAYCRVGERSSHSWFVLKYLLGYQNVTNYDGSWTELGNLVGVPIEGARLPRRGGR